MSFEIRFTIKRTESAWIVVLTSGRRLQFPIAMKRSAVLDMIPRCARPGEYQ